MKPRNFSEYIGEEHSKKVIIAVATYAGSKGAFPNDCLAKGGSIETSSKSAFRYCSCIFADELKCFTTRFEPLLAADVGKGHEVP